MKLSVPVVLALATLVGIASASASTSGELAKKKEAPREGKTNGGTHALRHRHLADKKKTVVSDDGLDTTTTKKMRRRKLGKRSGEGDGKKKKSTKVESEEEERMDSPVDNKAAKEAAKEAKKKAEKAAKNAGGDAVNAPNRADTSSVIQNRGVNVGGKESFQYGKGVTGDCFGWSCANVAGQVSFTPASLAKYSCEKDSDCYDNCCFGGTGAIFGFNPMDKTVQHCCFNVNNMKGGHTGCKGKLYSQITTDDELERLR